MRESPQDACHHLFVECCWYNKKCFPDTCRTTEAPPQRRYRPPVRVMKNETRRKLPFCSSRDSRQKLKDPPRVQKLQIDRFLLRSIESEPLSSKKTAHEAASLTHRN